MGVLKILTFKMGCVKISEKVADCGVDDGGGAAAGAAGGSCSATSVKKFSWEEIKKRTKNFSTVIGSGGFSTVYLARLPDSGQAAVKIQSACTDRLAGIHDQELQILLRLKHPNIVRLLGHSEQDEHRLLLLEYVPNGTLHDRLHVSADKMSALTWKARTHIAFQLAKALEYLHGLQVIHGDIKTSNILLDGRQNCKLCDFGSARTGFASMVLPPCSTKANRMIVGSRGYLDPDYLKTGLVSKKNDVYSYGVVLLELVTGREAFSFEKGGKLTEIVSPVVEGVVEVAAVVDPRLSSGDDGFDLEEVKDMVCLAGMCIGSSHMHRPCASQILAFMKEKFHFN